MITMLSAYMKCSKQQKRLEIYLQASLESFWNILDSCTFILKFWTLLKHIFCTRHIFDKNFMCIQNEVNPLVLHVLKITFCQVFIGHDTTLKQHLASSDFLFKLTKSVNFKVSSQKSYGKQQWEMVLSRTIKKM